MRVEYSLRAHTSTVLATVPRALSIPAMCYLMATGIAFDADVMSADTFTFISAETSRHLREAIW